MRSKFTGFLTLILALIVQFTFAQEKIVTGTVIDQDGLPLPGVSVLIKGTYSGTTTDLDGNYSISASPGDVLVFSFIGQKSEERLVGEANAIDVTLGIDAKELGEIVVVGYTSLKKSDITGSVVKVDNEKLSQVVSSSIDNALQGNVAGLTVTTTSGTPGSAANIRIRGISSITAGNEPLYVIDGIPVNSGSVDATDARSSLNALSAIDNNNIESITVLKDASATSQYGARGANGVILITTKSGKSGKTKISLTTSYGIQNDAVTGPVPLTAAQRLELSAEARLNDGLAASKQEATDYLLNSNYKEWDEAGRPEAYWNKALLNKNAMVRQFNLAASGGGEDHTFYSSIGYMDQEGTVIGTEFERISGVLKFTKNLAPKLTFSSNNSASYSYQNSFLEGSAYFESPRTAQFFLSPLLLPYNEDGTPKEIGGSIPNPLIISRENVSENRFTRIISGNELTWDIADGLTAGTTLNIDLQLFNLRTYLNRNYGYGAPTSGEASQYDRTSVFYVLQNYINYDWLVNSDHKVNFKVLQEYQTNRSYFLGGAGENFADDGLYNLDNLGKPTSVSSSFNDWYVGAYLGLIQYSVFDSKYVANLSYRREGNSRFSQENRWGNFWSLGGAWNLDKEAFLGRSNVINALKLRASYGVTGNASIELNKYQSLFTFGIDYAGEGAQIVNTYGNEDLSWEKSNTMDVGIDFNLFNNNLLSGSIAYFYRKSTDLLLNVPLSQTTGFRSQIQNIGELTNKGFEVQLNANLINRSDMQLSIGGNLGTVKNQITKLPLDPNGIERTVTTTTTRIETGNPVRAWYMPTWAGVNPETGLDEWYIDEVGGATTTVFNDAEQVYQGGNSVPTLTAGMNIDFKFKGFFINATGYYAGGNKIYEGWHLYLNQTNGYPISAFNGYNTLLDRWQKPGDIARNSKVKTSFSSWEKHSKYLYDGDFFRLRSLTVGYELPSRILKDIKVESIRVYVRGNNLYTWVKDDNLLYDPEQDLDGETGLETPPAKAFTVGLNINF